MAFYPHSAMVLAAGLGSRMRPLSLATPKPLLKVGGTTMLDYALDDLAEAGVQQAVINTFYLAEQITRHVASRTTPQILLSPETMLLETGGGIKQALPLLGSDPIFVLNADLPRRDAGEPALRRLAAHFDPAMMDVLLLVMPLQQACGFTKAAGDFFMENGEGMGDGEGAKKLLRHNMPPPRPYVYIAAHMVRPQCYHGITETVFSNNRIWDEAEARGRLYGLRHHGTCYHVGTPEDLADANRRLESGQGW